MCILQAPAITLSNGLRVANFSSPHPFNFVDGTILPACDNARSTHLALNTESSTETVDASGKFSNVSIQWELTPEIAKALDILEGDPLVDIILCPLPVLTAIKQLREDSPYDDKMSSNLWSKARTIRVADRITKAIFIDRFCI
jgi:hypothetical protein